MFKRLIAVTAVIVGLGLGAFASPAIASTLQPIQVFTEISAQVYGNNWVVNNFRNYAKANNLATVFNDVGVDRTYFNVSQIGNATGVFADDPIVVIRNDMGEYLSQWDVKNPAVNDWRARWNWVNGNVANFPSAQWIVVPVPNSNSVSLVEVSSLNNQDGPYALTVAQGGSVKETNGVPNWSGLVLLPFFTNGDKVTSTDKAQQFQFVNSVNQ